MQQQADHAVAQAAAAPTDSAFTPAVPIHATETLYQNVVRGEAKDTPARSYVSSRSKAVALACLIQREYGHRGPTANRQHQRACLTADCYGGSMRLHAVDPKAVLLQRRTFVRSVMAQKYCASTVAFESCRTASEVVHASSERCQCSSQVLACFFTASSGWWYSACTASSKVCRDIRVSGPDTSWSLCRMHLQDYPLLDVVLKPRRALAFILGWHQVHRGIAGMNWAFSLARV